MMVIFIMLYLTLAYEIQTIQTLDCYACSGGQECGTLFSPNSSKVRIARSPRNDPLSSCSITVTQEGLTTRDLVPSHKCRSSSYEFCCNEDLCNSLASPPLPALTSLKCAVGKCSMSNGLCIDEAAYVTVLSSATESCSVTFGKENYKYYKRGCQATIKTTHSSGRVAQMTSNDLSIVPYVFCCNSPECNAKHITNVVKDVAIRCYTCDSRITGLAGCMTFNESSPHVYKMASSRDSESCATIVGLEGRDAATGKTYPTFAIRTFIPKCVNQPLGHVSYGGAYFKGRIECCSSHFCNTQTLDTKVKPRNKKKIIMISIGIIAVVLLIVAAVVIGWAIYRCQQKKSKSKYDPCSTTEPAALPETLVKKFKKPPSKQASVNYYPEQSAAP